MQLMFTAFLIFVVNESAEIITQRNFVSVFKMISHRRIVVTYLLSVELAHQQGFLTARIADKGYVVITGHQMDRGNVLWKLLRIAELLNVIAKATSVTTIPTNPSQKVVWILFDLSWFFHSFRSWAEFIRSVMMILRRTVLFIRWWTNWKNISTWIFVL